MGTQMRFRLEGEEIRSLYATGSASRLRREVIDAIFGTIEAIEAAPGVADLRALISLRFRSRPPNRFEFGLPGGYKLAGRRVIEDAGPVLIIDEIRGEGKGRAV
jgi:hypothetical protein